MGCSLKSTAKNKILPAQPPCSRRIAATSPCPDLSPADASGRATPLHSLPPHPRHTPTSPVQPPRDPSGTPIPTECSAECRPAHPFLAPASNSALANHPASSSVTQSPIAATSWSTVRPKAPHHVRIAPLQNQPEARQVSSAIQLFISRIQPRNEMPETKRLRRNSKPPCVVSRPVDPL